MIDRGIESFSLWKILLSLFFCWEIILYSHTCKSEKLVLLCVSKLWFRFFSFLYNTHDSLYI
jgi:hypothetical protein